MQKSFNIGDMLRGAADGLRNMVSSAKTAIANTGLLGIAMNGLRSAAAGIASMGPVGWIGIASVAIPTVIALYNEWAGSAERAKQATEDAHL